MKPMLHRKKEKIWKKIRDPVLKKTKKNQKIIFSIHSTTTHKNQNFGVVQLCHNTRISEFKALASPKLVPHAG